MDKQTGPKGFLVVLPSEIIEIPQDSDKSCLTLFYSLPRELAEKWKPAYELPRCPYEVLRMDKYDHIVCDDMFKLLVWDCYAWCAWQFFQVKDRKGNYRDIPGNWNQYAGYFPLWRLSYSIIPYIRMKFEQNGLGFQNLYNIPQGVEVPWLTYQQFSNLIGNVTDMVISAYACDAKTADSEFLLSKRQYRQLTGREQASDVIAYQIRQSFKPGEVTPEEANQLGYEFARRFTKIDHAFIVCTHTDKQHDEGTDGKNKGSREPYGRDCRAENAHHRLCQDQRYLRRLPQGRVFQEILRCA